MEVDSKKIVNTIRTLGIDMIDNAGAGHPGIVLGAAPIIYSLFANHLVFNRDDPNWINRDRFILSSGHGSALLYSTLYLCGVIKDIEDLKKFRKIDSITPGHPEYYKTPGIDISTGPLGTGFASSVGFAIAERYFYKYFERNMIYPINHFTYVLCGEGDLEEGLSYEAASIAGNLKLSRLIVLYDDNKVQLDGPSTNVFKDDIKTRFESVGWQYIEVTDGEDTNKISDAIKEAKEEKEKPTIIDIHTVIGKYSSVEGTNKAHGSVLSKEDISNIKNKLDLRDIPFTISQDVVDDFNRIINERVDETYNRWIEDFKLLPDDIQEILNKLKNNDLSISLKDMIYEFPDNREEAPRITSGKILNSLTSINDFFIGGSADLASSCKTYIENGTDMTSSNYLGKNIWYGVREGAMGCIMNGLTLSGIRNFGSTFLVFSDYMRPSIRLASMMNLSNIYIFTHDSIFVGGDGPTHEAVEQLSSLRLIPNMEVFRPGDANEVLGVYKYIAKKVSGPTSIILARNNLKILEETSISDVSFGGYILKHEENTLDGIIIATGSELNLALRVQKRLLERGLDYRVVSMPSIERFNKEQDEYKESIIPSHENTFVIEAASSMPWYQFVSDKNHMFTVDTFGISASTSDIEERYGYTEEFIVSKIENIVKNK